MNNTIIQFIWWPRCNLLYIRGRNNGVHPCIILQKAACTNVIPNFFPKLQAHIIEGCAILGRSNEWYSLIPYIQTNIQPPNQPNAKNRFFDKSFTYRTHSAEFLIHWRLGRTQEGVLQNIRSWSDDDAFCRVSQKIGMIRKFLFCFRCFCEFCWRRVFTESNWHPARLFEFTNCFNVQMCSTFPRGDMKFLWRDNSWRVRTRTWATKAQKRCQQERNRINTTLILMEFMYRVFNRRFQMVRGFLC